MRRNRDDTNGNTTQITKKNIVTLEMNYVPNLLNYKSVELTRLTTRRIGYDSITSRIVEFQ